MNSLEKFNQYYASTAELQYEKSLKTFFESEVEKRLELPAEILDLGCGNKSIFADKSLEQVNVLAVDFSIEAIKKAEKRPNLRYELLDITKSHGLKESSFDLIFDSHCMHCIVDANDRSRAYKNILSALKVNGIFAGEMMVQSGKNESHHPDKHIPHARALEEEILNHGFKIIYFMIVRDLSFIQRVGESDLLRVIAKKSSAPAPASR